MHRDCFEFRFLYVLKSDHTPEMVHLLSGDTIRVCMGSPYYGVVLRFFRNFILRCLSPERLLGFATQVCKRLANGTSSAADTRTFLDNDDNPSVHANNEHGEFTVKADEDLFLVVAERTLGSAKYTQLDLARTQLLCSLFRHYAKQHGLHARNLEYYRYFTDA
jgi:hypothetical protein